MKKLVIFYSFEGNTRFIANAIARTIGADLMELKIKGQKSPKGFYKFLWGGKQVIFKKKPELLPYEKNPEDYDIIFLGTPVWAWSYSPAFKTFFSDTEIKNKKIALFCCHGGGKGKVFDKMVEKLQSNDIIGKIDFIEPLKKEKNSKEDQAKKWAVDLCRKY